MTYKIKVHGQGRIEEIEIEEWPCTITYQPERLNPESRKACDSLNSTVTQREEFEEILPPCKAVLHGHKSNR